jgi:hypothetical protein
MHVYVMSCLPYHSIYYVLWRQHVRGAHEDEGDDEEEEVEFLASPHARRPSSGAVEMTTTSSSSGSRGEPRPGK